MDGFLFRSCNRISLNVLKRKYFARRQRTPIVPDDIYSVRVPLGKDVVTKDLIQRKKETA